MEQVKAIFWIYKTCLIRTVELVRDNLGIIFAPIVYGILLAVAAMLLSPLGIIGGLIMGIVLAACASSGLYLIENVVRMNKATLQDFTRGFSVYLWDILTIAFHLLDPHETAGPGGFYNSERSLALSRSSDSLVRHLQPVPELIYQGRVSGLALLSASYQFIVENWVEWLFPNLLIGVAGYLLRSFVYQLVASMPFFLQYFLVEAAFGLFLTFLMIFRGLLFAELHGTTRRSRVYRYKARSSQ